MTTRFAGSGVMSGSVVGAADKHGNAAVDVVHPIREVHVTMLYLIGQDDDKLPRFHEGRYKQLSQFRSKVIGELIA